MFLCANKLYNGWEIYKRVLKLEFRSNHIKEGGLIMNADIIAKAANIINSNEEAYFSVVNSEGYPETATRSNIHPEGIKSCYFSTGAEGAMAVALKENSKTSVCFRQGGNNVTLLGVTKIITDLKVKKDLWLDWFIDHFPWRI
jgi:general stress protein 26